MQSTVRLPAQLGPDFDGQSLNKRVAAGEVTLDWTDVSDATDRALGDLLRGLELDVHADSLGLDTVPEALGERVLAVLETKRRGRRPIRGGDPAEGRPLEWRAPEVPETPVRESPKRPSKRQTEKRPRQVLQAPPARDIREELLGLVLADLLGPAGGPTEEIAERRVRDRYLVGALAPRSTVVPAEELDGAADAGEDDDDSGAAENAPPARRTFSPSSIGLSFSVDGEATAIQATARWGRYRKVAREEAETDDRPMWRREPMEGRVAIDLVPGPIADRTPVPGESDVRIRGLVRRRQDHFIVSLFLVNDQTEPERNKDSAWLFQAELEVEGLGGKPILVKRRTCREPGRLDPVAQQEEAAMEMAYRREVEFAVGHGTSVHAERDPGSRDRAVRIRTTSVPRHEVGPTRPPRPDEVPEFGDLVLDMKALAEMPAEDWAGALSGLAEGYERWIERQEGRIEDRAEGLEDYREVAAKLLEQARSTLKRIRAGIDALAGSMAGEAFRFMNRAMYLQRLRSIYSQEKRRGRDVRLEDVDRPAERSWYPFQLAFILINLPALVDLEHADRRISAKAVADLLWFPTGGGKTEAYLGLTAFALAIRRLQGTIGGRSGEDGVTVLMRYTLRLLTLQQFQRATTLLCACESIRREAVDQWGETPFRIGLWVGKKATPNTTEEAADFVQSRHGLGWRGGQGSPHQLPNCPWCGHPIDAGADIQVERFAEGRGRTLVYCGDKMGECLFSRRRSPGEGLPILVVDEEIYRRLPSLLIATVDKFAQLAWKGETQMLFGQVDSLCPRHGFRSSETEDSGTHPKKGAHPAVKTQPVQKLRPPDLIIQDELHLISGPLGTLVGLYETAIDRLATWEVDGVQVRPKVIASTATIRRASDQVQALFLRQVEVFPPPGLDAGDNFFARQREPSPGDPGRLYIGVCAPGRRLKGALIRVYVALLGAAKHLYERYGGQADPWMTLVGYFNSLLELGGMRRLVDDDIRTRLDRLDEKGLSRRRAPIVRELTSRMPSTDIPETLDELETPFDPDREGEKGIDVLLATNMISVGVDVARLGLMTVTGQPKATAEYIQATSRVGRKTPGLVVTVYNWARPRDLSHYERFEHYHATFYKHVEALSVTPFSAGAVRRGLSGLLVSLVRQTGQELNANESASRLERRHPYLEKAIEAILDRAEAVSGSRAVRKALKMDLEASVDEWLARAANTGGAILGYRTRKDRIVGLLSAPGDEGWDRFTCLMSLRNVEPSVPLILSEGGLE